MILEVDSLCDLIPPCLPLVNRKLLLDHLIEPGARQLLFQAGSPPQLLLQRGAPRVFRPDPVSLREIERLAKVLGAEDATEDGFAAKRMIGESPHLSTASHCETEAFWQIESGGNSTQPATCA